MHDDHQDKARRHGRAVLVVTTKFFVASMLLLWGWNTIAQDLFGLPAAEFKHAVGFVALIAAGLLILPAHVGRSAAAKRLSA